MIQEDPQNRDKIQNDYNTCARARMCACVYARIRLNIHEYVFL